MGEVLKVGEITLYSWSGLIPFKDRRQDLAMGAMWPIPWALPRALWTIARRAWAIHPPGSG